MKYCPRCETEKPLAEFGKHKKMKDGLRRECLVCSREIRKQWKLQNSDRAKEIDAKSRAANKDHKVAYDKARYLAKSDEIKQKVNRWQQNNRERHNLLAANWRHRNLEQRRLFEARRRARKRSRGDRLSKDIVERLHKLQRGRCACCGKPLGKNFHLDHIIPLARGGTNADDNVQLLTQRCNNQKSAKDPIDFMQSRGYLL